MTWPAFLPYLAVTAIVTYLIRMLPMTLFRQEIKSRFIRSFLGLTENSHSARPHLCRGKGDRRPACGRRGAPLFDR